MNHKKKWLPDAVPAKDYISMMVEYHPGLTLHFWCEGAGGNMAEELQITKDLTEDLLNRLNSPVGSERETAAEALAVSAEDEDWRPAELIRQGGVDTLAGLLGDKNTHVVVSALDIIIATASAGEEEALISGGIIAKLDPMQDHEDHLIRKKVREALWLLTPEVEDVITSKPQDEY
jgi:hypothetical protein